MKKIAFVFGLSACIALNLFAPLATQAANSTPPPSLQQLNDRLRQDIKETGKIPDLSSVPNPHFPNQALHVLYVVATNKRGQVVKVVAGSPSKDDDFNTYMYYNALQMFIHRADGVAQAGLFNVTYDYSPTTKRIKRDVSLNKLGGVDANAPSAVDVMLHDNGGAPHATSTPAHK